MMERRTEFIFCRKGEEKELISRLHNWIVPGSAKIGHRSQKGAALSPILTDIYLDPSWEELINVRLIQRHERFWSVHDWTKKMKVPGKTNQRLRLLKDWQNKIISNFRKKAAPHFAEAIACNSISTVLQEIVRATWLVFSEGEMIRLIVVILTVKDWHYLNGDPGDKKRYRRLCE